VAAIQKNARQVEHQAHSRAAIDASEISYFHDLCPSNWRSRGRANRLLYRLIQIALEEQSLIGGASKTRHAANIAAIVSHGQQRRHERTHIRAVFRGEYVMNEALQLLAARIVGLTHREFVTQATACTFAPRPWLYGEPCCRHYGCTR
jgi:hypothetical protein